MVKLDSSLLATNCPFHFYSIEIVIFYGYQIKGGRGKKLILV